MSHSDVGITWTAPGLFMNYTVGGSNDVPHINTETVFVSYEYNGWYLSSKLVYQFYGRNFQEDLSVITFQCGLESMPLQVQIFTGPVQVTNQFNETFDFTCKFTEWAKEMLYTQ